MEDFECKRKRYENGAPVIFILGCLINYNFKSFRKFLIYIFHFSGYLNLKSKDSSQYTNEELIKGLDLIYKIKVSKIELCKLTQCNNNTFNKRFKKYFELNNYKGRRKFTLLETYGILNEWQGQGKWGMMQSIKKEKLAEILNSGSYKKLATEYGLAIGKKNYKGKDKYSPREVKNYLEHIDVLESEKAEELLRYDDFQNISLWFFGIMILHNALSKNKAD